MVTRWRWSQSLLCMLLCRIAKMVGRSEADETTCWGQDEKQCRFRQNNNNNNVLANEAQRSPTNPSQPQPSLAKLSQVQPSPTKPSHLTNQGGERWGEVGRGETQRSEAGQSGGRREEGGAGLEKSQSSQLSPAKANQPFTQPSSANPPTKLSLPRWSKVGRRVGRGGPWMDGSGGRKRESKLE